MKRAIFAFLAAAALTAAPATLAPADSDHPRFMDSVAPLQWASGADADGAPLYQIHCTAGSINEQRHLWLLAAHCVSDKDGVADLDYFIGTEPVVVVAVDFREDLAIMQGVSDGPSTPALKMAKRAPRYGDSVRVLGYPYAFHPPFLFAGIIACPDYVFEDDPQHYTIYDMTSGPGDSGALVVDHDGRIIGVLQIDIRGPFEMFSQVTGGATWRVVKAFTRPYME